MRELCPWYALNVKHQHEFAVRAALEYQGCEVFLPTCRVKKRWSDRVKQIEMPLFGGYVFVRFPAEQRIAVLETPGVFHTVNFLGRPAAIPESEIETLRRAIASALPLRPWPQLEPGTRVRIERGPLRGVEGVLLREKEGYQLVIGVEMLRRFVAVELAPEMVSAISEPALQLA